jgi:hypothetical protein
MINTHLLVLVAIFVLGYIAARFWPQAGHVVGLP